MRDYLGQRHVCGGLSGLLIGVGRPYLFGATTFPRQVILHDIRGESKQGRTA